MTDQPAVRISPAAVEDAPLVYAIMQAAFEEYRGVLDPPSGVHAETLDDVLRAMEAGGAVLARIADRAVGTARYAFHENSTCYIGRVSVLPEFRGRGIASAMMDAIEQIAREHGCAALEIDVRLVLASNVQLYERLGYRITKTYEHPKGGAMVATMDKAL